MSLYNVRLYDYGDNQQIRIYQRYVEKDSLSVKNLLQQNEVEEERSKKERSDAMIQHSKRVSQNRTKQSIYEITRANNWDWFITLTFDREKIDSSDYELLIKTVRKWFNNARRKAPALQYIIVPELHADGIHYHFHGLLAKADGLTFLATGIVKDGKEVYNILDFKLGFTTATKVADTHKAAAYIVKYITKELENTIKGKRRYLASKNCKKAEIYEYNMTPEEKWGILDTVSEEITYMNTQHIPAAGQKIDYIEIQRAPGSSPSSG